MAKQTIDIGGAPNDGTGDDLRAAFDKANDNFDELYAFFDADAPPIPAGRWMVGGGVETGAAVGVAPGADSMRLYAVLIRRDVTITDLNVRVTTAAASGNVQIAIYAAHATTLAPTGAALYSSASQSTTGTGAIGPTGMSLVLPAGLYWFATNCDTNAATAVFASRNTVSQGQGQIYGSTTVLNVLGGNANLVGQAKSQTFGTWPTLTGSYSGDSLSDIVTSSVPVVAFKA